MKTKKWFLVRAICGHVGTHRYKEKSVFIYGEDVNDVLLIYGRLPSVKKDIRGYPFPTIRPVDDSEVSNLEGLIVQRRGISLKTVKENGYYFLDYNGDYNNTYDSLLSIVTHG